MIKEFTATSRQDWRNWLQKHHNSENKVWLIKYKKHTGIPTITNKEAMEEAICFGWIDTTVNRIDDEKYKQCFVKRTVNGRWSNNTQRYARDMIKQGKMTPAGLKMYKLGLKKPTLDHNIPKNPKTPDDLKQALEKNKQAKTNFNNFAPSYRRFYIRGVLLAKRKETREKRIKLVVERSILNKKPGIP